MKPGVRYDEDWRMEVIRKYVRRRDHNRCRECGRHIATWILDVHHRVEVDKGGNHSPRNLITLCVEDHAKKHPWMENLNRPKTWKEAKRKRQISEQFT
jgi:5-methylcytosine-specific restriction endonuclease McrA